MSFKFPKKYYFILFLFAIVSGFFVFWADFYIEEKEEANRQAQLEKLNKKAASELKDALNNYATLMSGIRSQVKFSDSIPDQKKLKDFINFQLASLPIDDSFVISFLDTTHTFMYSFNKDEINPSNLIGTSVSEIVGVRGTENLEIAMHKESFIAFDAFNLVEKRVGLPLGFGVLNKEGKSIGYFSIVTDFKPIIDRVYNNIDTSVFVFRFRNLKGVEFDRERVYDGKKIYNSKEDPEYWRNFDIKEDMFTETNIPFFNKGFVVGTAYKNEYKRGPLLLLMMGLWYFLLLGFMLFIIVQLYLYKRKNRIIAKQKEQLSELVATKNKFFTIIAHDLRSPLSSVINFLDVLKEEEFKSNQTNQIINALGDSSRNSLQLLDNLLKWSKVQTGKLSYEPEKIDFLSLVKDQIRIQKQSADQKSIKIVVEASTNSKLVADKNLIGTVIRNLLSNAIKYSYPKSIIVIEVSKINDTLSFSIEDNGIGIPDHYLKTLFDLTTVTTQEGSLKEKGSGLGLILSKQFVEMHDGTLTIESTHKKGTIATFILPL